MTSATSATSTAGAPPSDSTMPPGGEGALDAARAPVGTGTAPLISQLIALGVIALGVVGIQEAIVRSGASTQESWTSQVVSAADGQEAPSWAIAAGVAFALLGLVLLLIALKRRPRKAMELKSKTGLFLHTSDVARVISNRLDGIDGATDIAVRASRRKISVRVASIAGSESNAGIVSEVESRVADCLAAFERPPRIKVKVNNEGLT